MYANLRLRGKMSGMCAGLIVSIAAVTLIDTETEKLSFYQDTSLKQRACEQIITVSTYIPLYGQVCISVDVRNKDALLFK